MYMAKIISHENDFSMKYLQSIVCVHEVHVNVRYVYVCVSVNIVHFVLFYRGNGSA